MRRLVPALLLLTGAAEPATNNQIDWRWDSSWFGCALRQGIADGKILQVSRLPGSEQTTLFVGGADEIVFPPDTLKQGALAFHPGETMQTDISVWTSASRRDINVVTTDSQFMNSFAHASEVEFAHAKLGTVRVQIRSAGAAAKALRTCEDGRMRDWGIDPASWWALKSRPVPLKPLIEYLSSDDYPRAAQQYGLEGAVVAKLEVGPNGRVKDCKSIYRNRYTGFRDSICAAMMRRARFQPATNSDGENVASPYTMVVKFRSG